jgi:hypothetical protein
MVRQAHAGEDACQNRPPPKEVNSVRHDQSPFSQGSSFRAKRNWQVRQRPHVTRVTERLLRFL